MERALIVCDSEKGTAFYKSFLKENGFIDMMCETSLVTAKRTIQDYDFDICLINLPIGGTNSIEHVVDIAEKNVCQILLFVKADIYDETTDKVADYGIITVSKPISKQLFWQALKAAMAAQRRISMAKRENLKLEKKLDELKTISRAKLLLIVNEDVSEEEAHKLIEKEAMDSRISRYQVALGIIEKYNN
ncbi:response regulator receiver and ANTAR domain protein [Pseudobutyrivibrio sp. YE44]|uniref:ANTAR domain-containing response regulator n=1 Tax=Pseudobutyrivibrio sp. YE44 TaxID=1520802 RepID=UPI00088E2EF5|nr:ANTAR domain-containing protein [Pseudobutyrivibrio sp. YE44]SDB05254.1 response regulator receiver and ANTAR domain protein [Pseudobutyrivibrio sp. YE44]